MLRWTAGAIRDVRSILALRRLPWPMSGPSIGASQGLQKIKIYARVKKDAVKAY
jgi:hypothetical protein